MRLINVDNLKLETFFGDQTPPYAILSHRWGNDNEEVSFEELRRGDTQKSGMQKVIGCCQQAKMDKIKYAWIDTCCINKDSSKELDEAINSMFQWYRRASVCYTYLADVPPEEDIWDPASRFFSSPWFRRGWTLQELLAPGELRFYDHDWTLIGTKADLSSEIEAITGIPRKFLLGWVDLHQASVAQRMSWASRRETKRQEDIAYCLLGIFNVTMPMIYGEGRRAFERLQLKIMEQTTDDSILAWGIPSAGSEPPTGTWEGCISAGIFASSPANFANCGDIVPQPQDSTLANTFVISGGYVRTSLRVVPGSPTGEFGVLNCGPDHMRHKVIAIPLHPTAVSVTNEYMRPQGHHPFMVNKPETNAPNKEIRIQVDPQLQASQVAGSRFWLHVDGHQKLRLSLRETWPPLLWEKGRALIADVDSNRHSRQRYLARFSASIENTCDIIAVLDFDICGQQSSVDCYTVTAPNTYNLEKIGKSLDFMQQKDLETKTADNGNLAVITTVRKDEIAHETIFTLILTHTTELAAPNANPHQPISTAMTKRHFLESLYEADLARFAQERSLKVLDAAKEDLESMSTVLSDLEEKERRLAKEKKSVETHISQVKDDIRRLEALSQGTTDQQQKHNRQLDTWERFLNRVDIAEGPGNWLEGIIQKQLDRNKVMQQKSGDSGPGFSRLTFPVDSKQDMGSFVPLLWATANGMNKIAELLLEKGSRIDIKDNDDNTALLLSASYGHKTMVELLLEHGAWLEARNKAGDTPLARTAYKGHESTAALLLEKKADIEALNNAESTPLAIAARRGHVDVVKVLLDNGADYEALNQYGDSPLSRAAMHGHQDVVRLLLDTGARVNRTNKKGFTPLQLATKNGHEAVVKLLTGDDADVDVNHYADAPPAMAAQEEE
ncbi:hypothetical protein FSARC_11986 [Fusarium sarcochroum]|uniref:Heterokaryon incompatibility domain-containing protein n=1 Tax=Fusarium sarcochroum TaxID=1208366 RepID=A0A8H4TC79_9HYPO|nr:hypothetical protein FSARC_11986 [Fusarium sarcochroum]